MEEAGQEIEVLEHVYTTDFFLQSAFDDTRQVLSIYYTFRFLEKPAFTVKTKPFDFDELVPDAMMFRWIELSKLSKEDFTLPVDKMMVDHILTA